MTYQNAKKNQASAEQKYPLGLLLPIIAILGVIPLITYMYKYYTKLETFEWFKGSSQTLDFFLHTKLVWFIIACVYIIFCLIYVIFADEQKAAWTKQLIPLAIYCGITFISALASKYRSFSFSGIYEQFESVWALMGYCLTTYYCFFIMRSESAVKRIMPWFVAGISVMTALGLSQAFKHDFFRTNLGFKLMTPSNYTGNQFKFNFEEGRTYLSLYNPNYVGFYVCLVVPILVALIFTCKKVWAKLGCAFLIVSLMVILFASQSRAGILALAFSLIVMLLCMRKVFIKNIKIVIIAVILFIIAFIGINVANQGILINRLKTMFNSEAEYHPLSEITTNKDNVSIVYNNNTLVVKCSQDSKGNDIFKLSDKSGNEISYSLNEDKSAYTINDKRFPFSFSSVRSDTFNGFQVTIDDKQWYFTNMMKDNDTSYYGMTNGAIMKYTKQDKSISFLEKHYHFANMRGYIWARTIPLLKKYFFLGSGPDTFIIAFPNNDAVGLYNSGHTNEIITKPHCMFLQIGVQTGVISLIALLVFFIWYLVSSLKLYWKHSFNGYMPKIGVSIFVAVIGYLIIALTNDSCIAVAPIFYALIGMGLGINYKLKNDKEEVAETAQS